MHKLWYQKPAKTWKEALPIGNGFTGVMLFGGKKTERLAFNDCTLWSGYPKDYNASKSFAHLKEVRDLIFNGRQKEADRLTEKELTGFYSETFLPLGMLKLKFKGFKKTGYKRELDLSKAIHTVRSESVQREAFASNPDKVVVYHIAASRPFSMTLSPKSKLKQYSVTNTKNGLNLSGNAPDYVAPNYLFTERHPVHYDEKKGMAFALRTEIDTDGTVHFKGKKAVVRHAKTITLYCATATGFRGYDQMPDTSRDNTTAKCEQALSCINKNYDLLKERHIADHTALWERQTLSLQEENDLPTDKLVQLAKKGDVRSSLVELLYDYGKYLIIAGSREGGQPLNLQGQWNNAVRPPWSSNYTTNINAQMNYWAASRSNLSSCIEPLIQMVWEAMENGKKTAEINYNCKGFACNHNVDIWRKTPPVKGDANYMFAPLCGVWLANELFSHFQNGGLEAYRDKIFEIVREAAQFANDFLVLKDGQYVTCPSASPENVFISASGDRCRLDYASAFDMGLIKQAFANYLATEQNDALTQEIKEKQPLLFPFKNGKSGILEWHDDFDTPEKGHRHFSPLYAFYPGNQITYYQNPEETSWVKQLFTYRTENAKDYIGWSAAWAICLSGRLHDGQKAITVIQSLLGHAVFSNLFCVHPPSLFQIDGNLGFVAGINELLLYEENGIIDLLPALPVQWSKGSVTGMLVNSISVSFTWENGKVVKIDSDKPVRIAKQNLAETVVCTSTVTLTEREAFA